MIKIFIIFLWFGSTLVKSEQLTWKLTLKSSSPNKEGRSNWPPCSMFYWLSAFTEARVMVTTRSGDSLSHLRPGVWPGSGWIMSLPRTVHSEFFFQFFFRFQIFWSDRPLMAAQVGSKQLARAEKVNAFLAAH